MAHIEQDLHALSDRIPEKTAVELAAGGGIAEAVAAVGAVVLSIVGLAGVLPGYMMAIACIALGAALLFEGGATASRYSKLLSEVTERESDTVEVGGGVAAEALAGICGITLGILALLGLAPVTLVAVANIVFGAGLLLGSGATSRLNSIHTTYERTDNVQRLAREAVFVSAGGQVLIGVGAIVLGILALLDVSPMLLSLIGLLAVGGSVMLSGTAIGAKMLAVMHRY
jgi:hypothetical protein